MAKVYCKCGRDFKDRRALFGHIHAQELHYGSKRGHGEVLPKLPSLAQRAMQAMEEHLATNPEPSTPKIPATTEADPDVLLNRTVQVRDKDIKLLTVVFDVIRDLSPAAKQYLRERFAEEKTL